MKLPIVSYETAKQLKEIGFDWKCLDNYHIGRINGKKHIPATQMYAHDWNNRLEPNRIAYEGKKPNQGQLTTSAPTLALVQMWLNEKHNIDVISIPLKCDVYIWKIFNHRPKKGKYVKMELKVEGYSHNSYTTTDKALEAGILEAIKLIKDAKTKT